MKTSKLKMAISIILCFTIIFVSNTFSISAESENVLSIEPSGDYAYDINQLKILYSDRLDAVTLNEVIEVYLGDTELQLMYCSDARGAIDFVAEGLHNYSGTSTSGHYITIRAINGESGTAHIVDPHYSDAYFGDHVIYYDQLRTMLNGRYIIYTSSYA